MALTPEEQQRADELARLLQEHDEDEAAVAKFHKIVEEGTEQQDEK